MELFKTDMSGYYYNKNKNGITYYYSYKDKQTKKSKRKKILSCEEHTTPNLKNAINMTEDILKNEIKKSILEEKNQNLDETLNIEHLTLNEIIDIYHEKYYSQKYREIREMYVGVEENEFNNNAVVKKKLYGVKRRLLQYNKNFRNSSIGKMRYKDITRGKIINFLETELNTNLALKTKYNIFVYVKTAINYMISNGNIKIVNIFNTINIKNDRRQRTRVLSIEEIELLLKECQKWDKPLEVEISRNDSTKTYKRVRKANHNIFTAVYLAVITAARSSTVLTIKKKDIDLKNQTITLINHKAKNAKYKIPLNASSVKWFEKKLKFYKDNDYLIQPNSKQGKRLVGENNSLTFIPREVFNIMNELFNKDINRKVNFERDDMVNFHTIRRSVATNLAKSGVSIYKIKKLLDHRTVDITEHYLNLSYLDYKENLEIFQNELFKGFSNLKDEDKDEQKQEQILTIDSVKEELINEILKKSKNENNNIVKIALQSLSENELKQKLISYI